MSARISACRDPKRTILTIETSRFTKAGPVSKSLRRTLPQVPSGGAEKTDVSNHRALEPMPPSTSGLPLTLGLWVLPGARRPAALALKSIGVPEIAEKIPDSCQSPSTFPRPPSWSHARCGPHGNKYTKLLVKLCVESKLVRPQLRSKSAGVEIVPLLSPL